MTVKKMERHLAHAVPALATVLTLFVVVGWQAVLALPIAALSYLLIGYVAHGHQRAASNRTEAEQVSQFLFSTYREVTMLSRPLLHALTLSHTRLQESAAKSSLVVLLARMRLGQRFDEAIGSVQLSGPSSRTALRGLNTLRNSSEIADNLKQGYSNITEDSNLAYEMAAGSLHRYLVVSMVCTTILPSLAIFAFIGYSVLNYSLPYMFAFGVMLLCALPSISAVVNMKVDSLYGT